MSRQDSRKRQRGAAALEFAIVLPVLLMLLLGIIDFGLVMGARSEVANAAREGARASALVGSSAAGQSASHAIIDSMPGGHKVGTSVTVTCTTPSGTPCNLDDSTSDTGSTVTVKVIYIHTWLSPVFLGFSPTITLTGQSQMRIEA